MNARLLPALRQPGPSRGLWFASGLLAGVAAACLFITIYPTVAYEPPPAEDPPAGCVGPEIKIIFEGNVPTSRYGSALRYVARPAVKEKKP